MSAITECGDTDRVEAVASTKENKIVSLKPMGLASLLIQKLGTVELRTCVANFLTNRCLLCDERKHYLVKDDATGLFHFYCLECLATTFTEPYPDNWWTVAYILRMRRNSLMQQNHIKLKPIVEHAEAVSTLKRKSL